VSTHPLILQLDVNGDPHRWIDFETAAYYYAKDLVAWTPTADGFTIYGGTSRDTCSRSFMDMNTIIAVKSDSTHKPVYRTPTLTNRALFRRDQHLCAYCGHEFKTDKLTRDHIIPRSRKGKDIWTNVVTACGSCNRHKDARTPDEAGMKLLYLPYTPNKSEYLILMNRNILADQMEFLLSKVSKQSRLLPSSVN
jgi:hypothetical protein